MAFIAPIIKSSTTRALVPYRPPTSQLKMSLHPLYDVAAVSTYIAYFTSNYWIGEDRNDVEFFAIIMGLIWNFTHDHDATIFIFLWVIGGVSHFVSTGFLAGGNMEEYSKFQVGVRLGGYMSFLLLVFDLLDVAVGY